MRRSIFIDSALTFEAFISIVDDEGDDEGAGDYYLDDKKIASLLDELVHKSNQKQTPEPKARKETRRKDSTGCGAARPGT